MKIEVTHQVHTYVLVFQLDFCMTCSDTNQLFKQNYRRKRLDKLKSGVLQLLDDRSIN